MNTDIQLTDHAIERAKERLGWNRAALVRMMGKVLAEGLPQRETRGRLRRYLDAMSRDHRKGDGNRIWSNHLFVIQGGTLVTVIELPKEHQRAAKRGKTNTDVSDR